MDRLQTLQVFVRVVENGSFSATAQEMRMTQSSISKHIDALESQLKTKLIARTTRKLHLTEEGEKFYRQAKSLLEHYDSAISEVCSLKINPAGAIRLATSVMFGRAYITPLLAKFLARYPQIRIEHFLSDAMVDLIEDGLDLSIRVGELKDSSHQARRIGMSRRMTVATPAFLNQYGTPQHPQDLAHIPCVIYSGFSQPFIWRYVDQCGTEIFVNVQGPYQTDVSEAVREAVLAGMGVFPAAVWLVSEALQSGQLVPILQDYEPGIVPIYALRPASAYVPYKVQLLIDFLAAEFKLNPWISDE